MARKKWVFQPTDKALAKELAGECGVDPMTALLLAGRGMCDPFEIESFLNGDQPMADPYELPDMQAAVERIRLAMDRGERIAVCGDYDADGVTASAVLFTYLRTAGCDVVCYIPERLEEGYGLHRATIDALHQMGVTLIVTVDNGIGASEEVTYAAPLQMDVVVTDHHQPGPVLPSAVAVVDSYVGMPEDCFADYAGVGVAFKLVCALENCPCEALIPQYGELVLIGTVADVVPLQGENRLLVQQGLQCLAASRRVGLQKLMELARIDPASLTAEQVAFTIAPRLNAAGRMGKSMRAFDLLTTEDPTVAAQLAEEICRENTRRQEVESAVSQACQAAYMQSKACRHDRVIVVAGDDWHHGVLGIVAARLCNQFGKPAVVLCKNGAVAKGSARSLDGFNIFEAITACSHLLLQCGGHTLAAGLTLQTDRIDAFREAINDYAARRGPRPLPQLVIDCKLNPAGVNDHTAYAVQSLAPFGSANPVPKFALMNMRITALTPVGNGHSLRVSLARDGVPVTCMAFGTSLQKFAFAPGDAVDVAIVFRHGTYKGNPTVTAVVQDVRPAGLPDDFWDDMLLFEQFGGDLPLTAAQRRHICPGREELAAVFRYLRKTPELALPPDILAMRLPAPLNAGQLFVALCVFEEFGCVRWSFDGELLHLSFTAPEHKFDLADSSVLYKLQHDPVM